MSEYRALQLRLQRRFSGDIASNLSYTWSKSEDTSSGWFNVENGIGGGAGGVQNYWDIDSNRGRSGYDIPHLLTWSTVWELPFGRGKRWLNEGMTSYILGNWQLNWMLLTRSGQPFTPTVGGDPANIGQNNYARPNLVGDPNVDDPSPERWFNVAAFADSRSALSAIPAATSFARRVTGTWIWGCRRTSGSPPTWICRFRMEAFNVFNHINLGNPAVRRDRRPGERRPDYVDDGPAAAASIRRASIVLIGRERRQANRRVRPLTGGSSEIAVCSLRSRVQLVLIRTSGTVTSWPLTSTSIPGHSGLLVRATMRPS